MPSPPSAKGRHTELQATRAPPLPRSAPRQKNLRMVLLRRRCTPAGIRKADMKYVGMAERTAFTRIRRPPRESSLPRQPPRRFSTFSTTGCQSWVLRRSVNGRPKYRIGNVSIGVARISAQRRISSVASPNPTKDDLARFSWRPEKSANISIIWERVRAAVSKPWMKNVVSSAYWSSGMPPGCPAVWKPDRWPREHSLVVGHKHWKTHRWGYHSLRHSFSSFFHHPHNHEAYSVDF